MAAPNPVPKWTVDETIAFLGNLGLPQLGDAFRANAVNGSDLIGLTDEDFTGSLGCTPLQVKKIRKELEAWGIHGPGAPAPAPEAAAPAVVPEAVPAVAAAAAIPAAVAAAVAPPPAAVPTPPAGADRAAALQAEIGQLQGRCAEVQNGAQRYAQAQQHLRVAEQELGSAVRALTVTQVSGATETIQDMRIGMHGGGMFGRNRGAGRRMDRKNDFGHNMVEMATIQKAKGGVRDAAQKIQMAQQAVPNLPFIKPANVQAAMGGVFFNALLAPGLIGDMMQNAKVNKAKAELNEMHVEVKQALDWCVNNMNAAQAEAAQLNGALQMKSGELAALR